MRHKFSALDDDSAFEDVTAVLSHAQQGRLNWRYPSLTVFLAGLSVPAMIVGNYMDDMLGTEGNALLLGYNVPFLKTIYDTFGGLATWGTKASVSVYALFSSANQIHSDIQNYRLSKELQHQPRIWALVTRYGIAFISLIVSSALHFFWMKNIEETDSRTHEIDWLDWFLFSLATFAEGARYFFYGLETGKLIETLANYISQKSNITTHQQIADDLIAIMPKLRAYLQSTPYSSFNSAVDLAKHLITLHNDTETIPENESDTTEDTQLLRPSQKKIVPTSSATTILQKTITIIAWPFVVTPTAISQYSKLFDLYHRVEKLAATSPLLSFLKLEAVRWPVTASAFIPEFSTYLKFAHLFLGTLLPENRGYAPSLKYYALETLRALVKIFLFSPISFLSSNLLLLLNSTELSQPAVVIKHPAFNIATTTGGVIRHDYVFFKAANACFDAIEDDLFLHSTEDKKNVQALKQAAEYFRFIK